MKTDFNEHLKPKGQFVEEAVQAALAGRWEDAVEINQTILERFGSDEESNNRLGKAMTELGRFDEAKSAYEATLGLNPPNPIAQTNPAKPHDPAQHANDGLLTAARVADGAGTPSAPAHASVRAPMKGVLDQRCGEGSCQYRNVSRQLQPWSRRPKTPEPALQA